MADASVSLCIIISLGPLTSLSSLPAFWLLIPASLSVQTELLWVPCTHCALSAPCVFLQPRTFFLHLKPHTELFPNHLADITVLGEISLMPRRPHCRHGLGQLSLVRWPPPLGVTLLEQESGLFPYLPSSPARDVHRDWDPVCLGQCT